MVRIVSATGRSSPPPAYNNSTQPHDNHTSHSAPLTSFPENGQISNEQDPAPHVDFNQPLNPQELRPPAQYPPSINTTHSNTPSPSHTNSMGTSPNRQGGNSEFPPGGSPVPPGTNLSTDYSSTESLDAASLEHAETLLRIVTPPHFDEGDGGSGEEGGEEEEEEEEGGKEIVVDVGSVHVTEWGLEHTLRLREEGECGKERGSVGANGGEEGGDQGKTEGEGEDTLTSADCLSARQRREGGEKAQSSIIPSVGTINTSASHTVDESDTGTAQGPPDSPFSLSGLGLPTTPLTATQQPVPESGMSWWAEALAETQDMDDIDALVEQLDVTKATRTTGAEEGRAREVEREGCDGGGSKEEEEEEGEGEGEGQGEGERQGEEGEGEGEGEEQGEVGTGDSERLSADAMKEWEEELLREEREQTAGEIAGEIAGVSPLPECPEENTPMELTSLAVGGARTLGSQSNASSRESLDSVHRKRDRSSRSVSPSAGSTPSDDAYITQASRLIRMALEYERDSEFEEAFDLFKAAVDILLNGVQSEENGYTSHDCHLTYARIVFSLKLSTVMPF